MFKPTLIKRGQAWGCGSADIHRRHVCLPHDAVWSHPSHHRIVQARSMSAPTMDHPGLPPDLGDWDGSIRAHVQQMRTAVSGTCYMVIDQWRMRNLECVKHESGAKQGRVNKDCHPQKNLYGQNVSCDPVAWHCTHLGACRGNSIINWGCVILISHSFLDGIA